MRGAVPLAKCHLIFGRNVIGKGVLGPMHIEKVYKVDCLDSAKCNANSSGWRQKKSNNKTKLQ